MSVKALKERVFELTAVFETSKKPPECFAGVGGNFDNMGISFGVLQWNLGKGSLQPILKTLISAHRDIMEQIFQSDLVKLEEVLSMPIPKQVNWADKLSLRNNNPSLDKHVLKEPWKSYFKALGRTRECQILQQKHAEWFFREALSQFHNFSLKSERAYALMFDIMVQIGSVPQKILPEYKHTMTRDEVENMRIIARLTAEQALPAWKKDVLARKMCIANGSGMVHEISFDLEKDYGITLSQAVFEETHVYAL